MAEHFLRHRPRRAFLAPILIAAACGGMLAVPLLGQSLRPSRASLDRQNRQAVAHDFTFLRNGAQVRTFVGRGYLVPVTPNRDFVLKDVSFPYARPAVRTFLQRLGRQYRAACGEQLTVTSLTRPRSRQPWNASDRSVHPTGMALDLRRSRNRSCRAWIERTLLYLEGRRVLEASRERLPPHYHIALFPEPYSRYVARRLAAADDRTHRVAPGESLWAIARRYRTEVAAIKAVNRLRSNVIRPGQVLRIPAGE